MLKVKKYRKWSSYFHQAHYSTPIVAQIELTYACPLHCLHCYTGCYNNSQSIKDQLPLKKIKVVIDKLYRAGCLWLCFTGGDPLARKDFPEIYQYARKKGFIITVMTSLTELSSKELRVFKELPPFSLEITLNGANPRTFDFISQKGGSYRKIMVNIKKVKNAGLPLKIKTLLSKNNFHEKDKLQSLVESLGGEFSPSYEICSRLNGDTSPLQYRLEPEDILEIPEYQLEERCHKSKTQIQGKIAKPNRFFRCVAGNWQWFINPFGRMQICNFLVNPSYDLLKGSLSEGKEVLSGFVRNQGFKSGSKCKYCRLWLFCQSCPAKAKIEVGNEEAPIPYYCQLAEFSQMAA